uniref:C2 domain-containing protein n=1 Tax=Pyrodinium bahamense TaxID=73915 RepID=A0A7S0ADS4_9DINO|mmetsp:Transcript_32101/g.88493  ORF Transcript_32101/g.88493 Transcript_32101/m.88493 type:complete len:644 (+) Transcript_32101:74-2005(+)
MSRTPSIDRSPSGGLGSPSGGLEQPTLRRSSTTRLNRLNHHHHHREAVGRLRVRCVSASQQPTADVRLLLRPWRGLSSYMVVYLRDRHNHQKSQQRRTRVIPRTLNPQWREEFWFAVRKTPENLVLHADVFDQDESKEGYFLGGACMPLDHDFLMEATRKRQICDLELHPEPGRNQPVALGTAKLEVSWEPSLVFNSTSSARAVVWVLLRSPQALRVLGVVMLGVASLFLLVAQNSRWLCEGSSLPHCAVIEVPGVGTCALLSALCGIVAATVHFLGSAGLFGSGWDDRPPTLVEFAEADIEEEDDISVLYEEKPNLQLQVQSAGAFPATLQWNVSVATSFLPKVSMVTVRILAWLAHLAAAMLAQLAAVLIWANHGPSTFLAEASYLDVAALCFLLLGGAIFWQEGWLLRQQADKWTHHTDHAARQIPQERIIVDGTGGSGETNSPSLGFHDLAQRARGKLQTQMQTVSSLAQPLIEARQRLQERFDDLNAPLLDARQRLQGHLDELHLAQPLIEARQRIQEHLEQLDTLQMPSHEARSPHHHATAPPWIRPLLEAMPPPLRAGALPGGGPGELAAGTGPAAGSPMHPQAQLRRLRPLSADVAPEAAWEGQTSVAEQRPEEDQMFVDDVRARPCNAAFCFGT